MSYEQTVSFGNKSFLVLKFCKADNLRCYRESCEIVSALGEVLVCSRKQHSRRTRSKNRSVGF